MYFWNKLLTYLLTYKFPLYSETCDEGTPVGLSKLHFCEPKCSLTLKCTCDEGTPVM